MTPDAILRALIRTCALATVAAAPAQADPWPEAAREAASAYADGRFEEAATSYEDAVLAGATRPEIVYNLGAARYRAAEGDSAALAAAAADFQRAAARADAIFRPRALYNRANMHALLGDLQAAADGYRETLRQDPTDEDARYNLELVQRLMREQQQESPSPESQEGGDEEREQNEQNEQNEQDQQNPERQDPQPDGEPPPEDRTGEEPPQPDEGENESSPADDAGDGDESPETAGQPEETGQQASSISPEEAMRQLDKLEEAERELLRQLLLQRQRRIDVEKDW